MSLTGNIYLNQHPFKAKSFARKIAYVQQNDVLYPFMTVFETLLLAANFKMSKHTPLEEKEKKVDTIINLLGLTEVRDKMVGTQEERGLSGGEKKRLNVAIEMISSPQILFLDEPTTGLDSF